MTRIKFCGLRTLDDIYCANKLLPEYVGFVFAPKSNRYISPAQAKILRDNLSEKISATGFLLNSDKLLKVRFYG